MKKLFSIFLLTLLSLSVSAQSHEVKLIANPNYGGKVGFYSNPYYAESSNYYNEGKDVDCYATAKEGFRFAAWKRGNAIVSTNNPMTFVMGDEDLAFEAVFLFDPASPDSPGESYYNAEAGEMRIVNYQSGDDLNLIEDVAQKLSDDINAIQSLTLVGNFYPRWFGISFSGLKSLDLSSTTISTLERSSFSGNPLLESLMLPASVESMNNYLFGSDAIKDIYCYASVPPQAKMYSFLCPTYEYGDSSSVTYAPIPATVHVPASAVTIYQSADYWKDLTIVPMNKDDTYSITVELPAEAADGKYQNMILLLEDRATLAQKRYTVSKQVSYLFSDLPGKTSYNIRLENAWGQVLGEVTNVLATQEGVTVAFPSLKKLCTATVYVQNLNGIDLTAKTQVKWTLADGTVVGQQPILGNVLEGTPLTCQIRLGEGLATSYSSPEPLTMTVQPLSLNTLTCQLQPLRRVTLSGQVTNALTGRPLMGASVVLRQLVGGLYSRSSSATTDEEGHYSLAAYSENGTLSFSSTGCFTRSIDIEAPTESQTMETIALQSLTGSTIGYMLTYTPAVAAGETPEKQENYSDDNVSFEIYNMTKGMLMKQFVRQGNRLIITEGADIGDELRVTMTSLPGSYNPVEAQCTIDDTNYAEATFDIVERGKLVATPAEGSLAGIGLLYNSSGQLLRQENYNVENLTLSNLPDGDYTLVSMGTTSFFKSVLRLSALAEAGLVEGADYVTNTVSIRNGQQTAVNVGVVPFFDESRFYYTATNGTSFMADKASLNIGDYETLRARVQFKAQYASRISNVQLVVDLPDGVKLEASSLRNYLLEGQRVTVNIDDTRYVRFCVITAKEGNYHSTAFVRFRLDGKEVMQPIGSVYFETTRFTIEAPKYTQNGQVYVWGKLPNALAGSELQILDNSIMVAQTIIAEEGNLSMEVPLYKPLNNSWHQLTAKVISSKVGVLESLPRIVQCYDNVPILENIQMINNTEISADDLTFYTQIGKLSKLSYTVSRNNVLTFVAVFSDNDPAKIKDLWFNVYTTDGKVRPLNGIYDTVQQRWMASDTFDFDAEPISVTADYTLVIDDQKDHETMFNDQVDVMHQASLHVKDMVENHMTSTLLTDEENKSTFIMESENGRQLLCESTAEDYDAIEQEMFESGNMQCTHTDDGIIAYSVKSSDNDVQLLVADSKERIAVRVKLSDYIAPAAAHARRRISFSSVLSTGFGLGGEVLDLLGYAEYLDIPSQLSQLDFKYQQNLREQQKLFDRALKRMGENCVVSGDPALSPEQKLNFLQQQKDINEFRKQYEAKAEALIDAYKKAAVRKGIYEVGTTVLSAGASKAFKIGKKIDKMMDKLDDMGIKNEVELLKSGLEFDYGLAQELGTIPSIDEMLGSNFGDVFKEAMDYMNDMNGFIRDRYNGLIKNIEDTVDDNCKKGDDDDPPCTDPDGCSPPPPPSGDPDPYPAWPGPWPHATPFLDPQGYVYEGVPSNRLAGVTATVYFKQLDEDQNGNPVEDIIQWDSAPFGQINPQITGADGMYQWFVPEGLWQVKVEKEGYETAYSEWLPVPPPQLDVNIAMKQGRAPEVKDAKAYEEGINITFDKYMLTTLLTTDNISVLQGGDPVEGTIELQDKEATEGGDSLVSKVRFVPETPFTQNKVTLSISRNVQSYAYMLMPSDYEQELDVELEVKELKADSVVRVTFGESTMMSIKALPVAAAAGKTVKAKVANAIAAVNDTILVLNEQGKAQVEVAGRLLGETVITFTLEGTDLTAQTIVRVKEKQLYPVVATPVASLASESTVEAGTQVTLTCETENARIWYTLDGSCPCVSGNRILYTEPIVLHKGDITLKVMADAEGYMESEVATYIYHVIGSTSIITIDKALYATYVAPFDVDITSNDSVKAYAVTAINDDWIAITETATVPAGEAVVVKADKAGKYHVQKTTNAVIGTNLLKSAPEAIEAEEVNRLYVLTDGVDGVGFYPVMVGMTIPAGNGYLEITAGGINFYTLGETTDVKGIVVENLDGTHTIYNLNGQRISDSQLKRGIYIVNGNKIVIK